VSVALRSVVLISWAATASLGGGVTAAIWSSAAAL
jgi:hypothetical protein